MVANTFNPNAMTLNSYAPSDTGISLFGGGGNGYVSDTGAQVGQAYQSGSSPNALSLVNGATKVPSLFSGGSGATSVPASGFQGALGTVGGVAAGAGIGALFNQKNQVAGAIGGGVGALVGQAVIPIPGVGAVLGGAVGGLASKIFGGGKPKARVSMMVTNMNPDGTFAASDKSYFGNKTMDKSYGQKLYSGLQPQFQEFSQALGGNVKFDGQISAGYHSKWGGDYIAAVPNSENQGENVNPKYRFNFDPKVAGSYENAVGQAMSVVGQRSGYNDQQIATAIQKVKNTQLLGGRQQVATIADKKAPTATSKSFDDVLKAYHVQQSSSAASPTA